jgi:O-antigen ligase
MSGSGTGLLARLRPPPVLLAAVVTGLALVVLIPIAVTSTAAAIVVVFAIVLLLALTVFGFGHTSEFFVILGACLVPMSNLHPVEAVSFITVADAAFAVGFTLMLPDLLRRPLTVPTVFVVGVAGVLTVALFSSILSEQPGPSLNVLARLLVGAFGLSILIIWWNPDRLRVLFVASAYVLGNVISVGWAVVKNETSSEGRRAGLAEHPNVYGLCALLAVALIPFLLTQFPRSWRWLVVGLGVVCLYGVWSSGSRGALAALIAVAVIFPVLARSVLAALALLAAVAAFLTFSGQLLGETSSSNALGRLLGSGSASASDQARENLLSQAFDQFLSNPVLGNGLADLLAAHVIYLQVAAGVGLIGLAFYLLVLWATVSPIAVLTPPYSLLALPALAYVTVGFVTPVLWDRYIWTVLALALLAPRLAKAAAPADDEDDAGLHRGNERAHAPA